MSKQEKEKRPPAKALGMTLLTVVICLAVLGYFGLQGVWYLSDPLTTVLAYGYQVSESVEVSGCVVRQEQPLPDSAGGLLRIQRAEGERVSAGGRVAAVYTDQASLDRHAEADALTQRLDQLQYAQSLTLEADTAAKLDSQIARSLLEYRRYVTENRLYDAEGEATQLRALVLKRDSAEAGGQEDLSAQIQELERQIQALRSQAAGSVRYITAPVAGLYSAETDGYESLLTPERLPGLTPSQLAAIEPDSGALSPVGKLVLGDTWYYAAVVTSGEAAMLQEQQESGTALFLRFAKGVDRDLPVTLTSAGPEEGGRMVALFQGNTYLQDLTLLRQQRAEILYGSVEGLRVPKDALRAEKTTLDDRGQRQTERLTGVYCMVGLNARFKPVEVLYSGEGFVLVRPGAADGQLLLRAGDEVIVSASGLYDGKIMQQ